MLHAYKKYYSVKHGQRQLSRRDPDEIARMAELFRQDD
jgi:hypothetical protein